MQGRRVRVDSESNTNTKKGNLYNILLGICLYMINYSKVSCISLSFYDPYSLEGV